MSALALGLAACGSDDDDDASGDTPASEAEAPEATETEFTEASGSVRGFDGETIRLASIGIKGQLPGTEVGARARIARFNEEQEIEGVELEYVEFADDKLDPATALSEARRLVTQEEVFAIVGDVSPNNPVEFFEQQKVPYFGWAFDNTYCTEEPSTDLWGFGIYGCLVPDDPPVMPDQGAKSYAFVSEKTGEDAPTLAVFGNDTQSGKNSVKFQSVSYSGAGFDVVFKEGLLPPPPVSDYTPYVQRVLEADGGEQPDAVLCLLSTDCIPMWKQLEAGGFEGTYIHTLYSDVLVEAMKGTVASINFVAFNESTPALETMKADVAGINADQAIDTGVSTGYFSTDMFIQALKKVAEEGTEFISPENIQKAAATQTWEIDGLVGPVRYPEATVKATPYCNSLVESDGTAWNTVIPYSCSEEEFEIK